MRIPNYITQNEPLEKMKFNKISNCNASSRTFLSESDIFFPLVLVQVVKNTVTARSGWCHGLDSCRGNSSLTRQGFLMHVTCGSAVKKANHILVLL